MNCPEQCILKEMVHYVLELSTLQFGALQFSGVPRRSVYRMVILNILAASCANILYIHSLVFDRPGVAGAVLQTALSFID